MWIFVCYTLCYYQSYSYICITNLPYNIYIYIYIYILYRTYSFLYNSLSINYLASFLFGSRTKSYLFFGFSIKIQIDYLPVILFASLTACKIFYYIIQSVPYNSNVVKLDRKDILIFLDTKDNAMITKGLKELVELSIIKRVDEHDKNLYALTMNAVVRGNVDTMVKQYKKEREKAEFAASQKILYSILFTIYT